MVVIAERLTAVPNLQCVKYKHINVLVYRARKYL